MNSQLLSPLVVLILCFYSVTAQQDVLNSYVPGTIAQTSKSAIASEKRDGDQGFASAGFMLKARAIYKGSIRKVPDKKIAFLKKWLKNNQYPSDFFNKFEQEALFAEGDQNYWLIMQDVVTPHFLQEIKPEQAVDLYMIFLGSFKESEGSSLVVLVNEFKRTNEDQPSGPRTGKPNAGGNEGTLRGYERYVPRTLREIIDQHSNSKELGKSTIVLTGDTFPSKVKVTYSGISRPLPPERKKHLELLITSFNVDPSTIAKYETELLFKEGSQEHWVPVVKELVPFFEKELKKDDEVILYAEWVGANKFSGKWDWVFIVNEFQKPASK